ncbi:inosine/xanthosine triphosphatase [Halobellus ordinarius]|uniref:inosine/xanthosine triphosphatase n=1 Tax=Halobellus ordinarius TaxID=3075120 RepID=UPI0028802F38|nr:inosine/xanthosine triphosphatase [Halobellus sp. ZY16]
MRIAVGSGNPVKRDATVRVFPDATVVSAPVPSGVSEQPIGHSETRAGARNRAEAALDADVGGTDTDAAASDLGVGIEGGVAGVGAGADDAVDRETDADALHLVMWAAVTDGDRWGVGSGPSLPLPASIGERVRDGEELGPVMDDVLGESDVAKKQGAAGAFTAGQLTRTDALAAAVAAAASPFLSDLY